VRFVDSTGRRLARPLSEHPTQAANGFLSWAPDGRRLAVASVPGATPGSVWLVDPTDAVAARKLLDLPITTQLRGLSWSRDGRALLAGVDARTSDIILVERDGGK
jgi:dipeptidyl aminopeptidase/acylaminoacyl peptidase